MPEPVSAFPQLETKRLLLHQISVDDTEAIYQYYSDPRVTEFFMNPLTDMSRARAIAEEYAGYNNTDTGIVWGIYFKDNPALIGTCGYEIFSKWDKRGDIGYDLATPYWGQGIMKEALLAVIKYSFTQLDLNRIQAFILSENTRSIQLLKSMNFKVDGVLRQHRWFRDRFWDNVVMSLLKMDWPPA
jgi:ribosomal-protein-alanine N-acetyltransferase